MDKMCVPMTTVVNPATYPGSPTCGIQETIATLPEGGGVVLIPHGKYLVRRSICLPSRVTLRGEGAATVLTRPAPVIFELTAPSPANRIEAGLSTIEGLKAGDEIWIVDHSQGGWNSRHMEIKRIAGQKVEGTLVAGLAECSYTPDGGAWGGNFFPMVLIHESEFVTIEELMIDGGSYAYDAGRMPDFTSLAIHGVGARDLCVRNVIVRRWPMDGIGAQGGTASVTGCLVEDCLGNGYHPGTGISQSVWTNNIARRNGWNGIYFCLNVRNAVVSNSIFTDNKQHGIGGLSDPDAYNVITGNVIARNGWRGIDAPLARGNVIANNLIQDNSQSVPGMFAGIRIENHSGNVVTGNSFVSAQKTPTQTLGIEALNPADDNLTTGNLIPSYPLTGGMLLPRAEMRAAASAPKLDGRLDDAAWMGAERVAVNRRTEDGAPMVVGAEAMFLHDDRFVYVGMRCAEPLMAKVRDIVRARGGNVWYENVVELFFDPGSPAVRCYQLGINSLGTVCELQYTGEGGFAWDSKGQAEAFRGSDFWSATIAIPLAAFGVKELKAGQEWKMNICRTRRAVFPNESTAWSPPLGEFKRLPCFGTLVMK